MCVTSTISAQVTSNKHLIDSRQISEPHYRHASACRRLTHISKTKARLDPEAQSFSAPESSSNRLLSHPNSLSLVLSLDTFQFIAGSYLIALSYPHTRITRKLRERRQPVYLSVKTSVLFPSYILVVGAYRRCYFPSSARASSCGTPLPARNTQDNHEDAFEASQ